MISHIIDSFLGFLNKRDPYTAEHSWWVARISGILANSLDLDKNTKDGLLDELYFIGKLHDWGKIIWPDIALGSTIKERAFLEIWFKEHPLDGTKLIWNVIKHYDPSIIGWLLLVLHHHYYRGGQFCYPSYPLDTTFKVFGIDTFTKNMWALLAKALNTPYSNDCTIDNNDIRLKLGIIQVADSFHAATSNRPYRRGRDPNEVIENIQENTPDCYHPNAVTSLIHNKKSLVELAQRGWPLPDDAFPF